MRADVCIYINKHHVNLSHIYVYIYRYRYKVLMCMCMCVCLHTRVCTHAHVHATQTERGRREGAAVCVHKQTAGREKGERQCERQTYKPCYITSLLIYLFIKAIIIVRATHYHRPCDPRHVHVTSLSCLIYKQVREPCYITSLLCHRM